MILGKVDWAYLTCRMCTVPCSSFSPRCSWPGIVARVSHNLKSLLAGQWSSKSPRRMMQVWAYPEYELASFSSFSVIRNFSSRVGRSRLGSRYCQRWEKLVLIIMALLRRSSCSGNAASSSLCSSSLEPRKRGGDWNYLKNSSSLRNSTLLSIHSYHRMDLFCGRKLPWIA